jgi:hypothetical protein
MESQPAQLRLIASDQTSRRPMSELLLEAAMIRGMLAALTRSISPISSGKPWLFLSSSSFLHGHTLGRKIARPNLWRSECRGRQEDEKR